MDNTYTTADSGDNIREYLLGMDDINRPKMIDMSIIEPGVMNSAILLICRLILIKKGSYPDRPDLGIDIVNRYRFAYESELRELASELDDQIQRFLPELLPVDVEVQFGTADVSGKPTVVISITIDKVKYSLMYNTSENKIEGLKDISNS